MKLWCSVICLAVAFVAGCVRYHPQPLIPTETLARLEQQSLSDPGLRSFLETNLHRELAPWPAKSWDLEMLTLTALYYHPSLDVARAQWDVARAGTKTAGGRPNPVVTAMPGYTINPASGVSPWIPLASIDLPIETAGKRGRRIEQSSHLAEAARLQIASVAWQVRSQLRASLLDYTTARQRAGLLEKQLQAQQQIVSMLEERLRAGAIARSDLTLPTVALTKAGADYAEASRLAGEGRARVAEALGLPVKALDDVEFEFSLPLSAEAGRELASAEARQQALLGRADVLAALAEYAASESALQLEVAKQYPDIHINPNYQFDQGEHKWSLGISAELPVLNQNQGPIAEAKAKRVESAARFVALQARIIADIDRALAARAASLEQVARQAQLTRLAREQSNAAEAQFKAGAADKLEVASAQFEASATDLAFLDAQVKAQQAVAQLEDAIQRPLGSWPALEQGRNEQAQKP